MEVVKTLCQKCGHKNDSDAQFCEKCGEVLNTSKGRKKINLILIATCIILIIALGFTSMLILNSNEKNANSISEISKNNYKIENKSSNNQINSSNEQKNVDNKNRVSSTGEKYWFDTVVGTGSITCPECGSNNWISTHSETETHSLLRCNYCGNTWWEPFQ
ncbi:MAG TPA: zinc-ribbon domain-containing protein [Methanothermobacter sp.]|nr:zinc-ribbon domain-containing protein [Methanothermobacter sp.]